MYTRTPSSDINLDLRATFDQIEHSEYELNGDVIIFPNYLVESPLLTRAPRSIVHRLKDKKLQLWKTVTHDQCSNNHKMLALLIPFPISDSSPSKQLLRQVLVSAAKHNPSEPGVHDL